MLRTSVESRHHKMKCYVVSVMNVFCMYSVCVHTCMSVLTGDEGTSGAGIPRHVTRQSRLLEERDGASDTRDRTDVRRQVGHNEE